MTGKEVNEPMEALNRLNSNPTLEEYLLIWENTNDAIFILRYDGAIIQANPALTEILGWTLEEIEGVARVPFFLNDFTPEDHEVMLNRLRSGASISYFETKRKHKNGTVKDILASYRAINREDVLAVAMYKDITEEKQAKHMLQIAENCYRSLVDYSPDAILVQSSGKISFANPTAIKMVGAQNGHQIIGNPILNYIQLEDANSDLTRVLRQEEMIKTEPTIEQLRRVDGTKIWVEIIAIPVQYEGGMVIQAILRDVTVRKYYEDQLTYMATHDPMTDVVNRSTFMDELSSAIEESTESEEIFALLYVDLDKFKEINDSLGHGMGDLLLIQFAERMKQNVRHRDVVGRIGGDEFLILLRDIDRKKVDSLVKRMHANFSLPYVIEGQEIIATSSIGVALYPEDATSSDQLMQFADEALYKAKKVRNHYRYFNK